MMINARQLKAEIKKRQQEMKKLQQEAEAKQAELDRQAYAKTLRVFADVFLGNENLINLVRDKQLKPADLKVFATHICDSICSIYDDSQSYILAARSERASANAKRKQRRAAKSDNGKSDFVEQLIREALSEPADTPGAVSAINADAPLPYAELADVRQY
jgi:hypothetical protein